ncbi:MAG TPA: electron transfer flavoprotein subunit alpha/FixB family protein [Conexibacter sp.]
MAGILVMAETRRGELRDVTLELIAAGRELKAAAGDRLVVAVAAADPSAFAAALGADGVDEVLAVTTPTEHFEPHVAQQALEALIAAERPALVLLAHSIDSLGFGPAVAARRNLGFASDVTALAWDDGPVAVRGAYGDKLRAELDFPGKDCTLLMLRAGSFPSTTRTGEAAPVRAVDVALEDARSAHVAFREPEGGDVDIAQAKFVLAIGRGVGDDAGKVAEFERLAERWGATLAVSRPLVDAGWVSAARQVGQSGKTVKPAVYVALGISGAVQHLAGMRTADTIIAVNTDPEAPIFGVAHYGAAADLFEVAEALQQQLG